MKLHLVLLLTILGSVFAKLTLINKVEEPKVKLWTPRSSPTVVVSGSTTATTRILSLEAKTCEFIGSPLDSFSEADIANPVDVGTEVNVNSLAADGTTAASNTVTVTTTGTGCAKLCYVSSTCTHYNYNFEKQQCSLFSARDGVSQYEAVPTKNSKDLCGIKSAATSVTSATRFAALAPAVGNIQSAANCAFSDVPFAFDDDSASQNNCATACDTFPANGCSGYEYFADQKLCFLKKTARRNNAVIYSTSTTQTCGAKTA